MAKPTLSDTTEKTETKKTCFVMMPISDTEGYPDGHFNEVYTELIMPAVAEAGYECVLATSTGSAHMIQLEVVTKIATAPLCICDLSTNNPNVLFEYGLRQAFDLPTVLIKDTRTRRIFDLSGFRDIEYDHTLRIANILASRKSIVTAINDTVAGAEDGQQVFSLVKLMNLAKAALPQGDIDPKDARFELLERKLDDIAASMERASNQPNTDWKAGALSGKASTRWRSTFAEPTFFVHDGTAFLNEDGTTIRIESMADLVATKTYKQMTPVRRAALVDAIRRQASKFVTA